MFLPISFHQTDDNTNAHGSPQLGWEWILKWCGHIVKLEVNPARYNINIQPNKMSTHTVHYCTTCWLSFFGKIINWHIALSLTVANFEPNIQLITSALAAVDSFSCFPCLNWICWWTLTCLSSIWLETITFPDSPFQLQIWTLPWRKCRRQSCTLHWEIQSTDFQAAWIIQKKCRQWCQVMKPSKIENIYILWEWSRICFFQRFQVGDCLYYLTISSTWWILRSHTQKEHV